MKKIISLLCALTISLSVFALGPRETYTKFLKGCYSRDYKTSYNLLAEEYKEEKDLAQFQRFVERQMDVYYYVIDLVRDNFDIEYTYEELDDDSYYAEVDVTVVADDDKEILDLVFDNYFSGKTLEEGRIILNNAYKGKKVPLRTIERECFLVLEDGQWKVDLEDVDLF